jgi:hypothetical protein
MTDEILPGETTADADETHVSSEADASTADASAPTRPRFGWASAAIALAFALLYGYDLWEAITNAIELPRQYAEIEKLGIPVGDVPWTLIIANMLIPPVVYLFAVVLGLRRRVFGRAVLFAAGLALVAVLSLDIIAIA